MNQSQPTSNPPSASFSDTKPAAPRAQRTPVAEGAGRLGTVLMVALYTLLGVNLLVMAFGRVGGPSQAAAQVSGYTNGGLVNALPPTGVTPAPENIPSAPTTAVEMLKRLLEQQIETNARLARIEGQFGGEYRVNVTNWPAPAAPAK